jgi:putative tryptophan/tyrosine transport system substrate-binding protein
MQLDQLKRRQFITLLAGAAAAWPVAARAQQPTIPVVGYVHSDSPQTVASLLAAFREGLSETGYVEGQNVAIEYRWAQNDLSRIPELVADLVRRRVDVIAAPGSSAVALAAKAATTTIPIVFSLGLDPVQLGLVASLSRPGGNITGVNSMSNELVAKRLGLLHELLPTAIRFGVLVNPQNPTTDESLKKDVEAAAAAIGPQIDFFTASTGAEIDTAFGSLLQRRADALVVHPDNLFINRRVQLITLAARHAVPVMYPLRPDAEAGGLMSYGTKLADAHRQAGVYTGRILKGAKPADLPVVQPTKFEFIINLQTAKTIGLKVPPTLLARTDEVIE